jgi:hypothetical protein
MNQSTAKHAWEQALDALPSVQMIVGALMGLALVYDAFTVRPW